MQKNNKKWDVNSLNPQPKLPKSNAFATNRDFVLIETLSILFQPISVTKNEDIFIYSKKRAKGAQSSYKTDRKVNTTQLVQQFSSQSDANINKNHKPEPVSSFAQHIKKKQSKYKNNQAYQNTNTQFDKKQGKQQNKQSNKQSPSKYFTKKTQITRTINQNEQRIHILKQQNSIRQSTMTFSPLRIDISLPSLCTEDFGEVIQQRQMINQIEKDIKHLIHKIKQSHYDDTPFTYPKKQKS